MRTCEKAKRKESGVCGEVRRALQNVNRRWYLSLTCKSFIFIE